jgi:dihydroorotase-like cyclic amidohydrolase
MNRIESGDLLSSASWSPYLNKEMAPKPELVIVAGEPICQGGSLIPDTPSGRWIGSETA